MPSLLIRDLDEDTKRLLAVRAAENGRSQQAEAKAIIEEALIPESHDWASMLRERAKGVDGIDIPLPQRHEPRITGVVI